MTVEPSKPGKRPCIQCGRVFRSPDRERIRRCPKCKKGGDPYSPRQSRIVSGDYAGGSFHEHE